MRILKNWRARFAMVFIGIFIPSLLLSQDFYFHKSNYADSASLAETIPQLAKEIQESSQSSLPLNSRMNLSLAAKRYEEALTYIDSLRMPFHEDLKNGIYVPFEVYAMARKEEFADKSFEEGFKNKFSDLYSGLKVPSQLIVDNNASISIENIRSSYNALIVQSREGDTLQLNSALRLIQIYNFYQVYQSTLSIMEERIQAYHENTYAIKSTEIQVEDSLTIRAHIVRKKEQTEPLPTIFIFNIYADSLGDIGKAKYYAAEGYACVVANMRGKGIDSGEIAPFEYDAEDAYEIIDWISTQDWCNGKVGMVGGSYLGFSQWASVKQLHPALKTIMPQVAVAPGIDYPMNGNVFMSYMLRWIHYVTANRTTDYPDFSSTEKWNGIYKQWYKQGRPFSSMDRIDGRPSEVFQRWLDHPSYDEFWQSMVPYETEFSKIDIPILTTTGYFDDDQMGAMYYYKNHHKYNPDADHYLVIGPYTHGGAQMYPDEIVGGYEVEEVASEINFRRLSVEWFDYVLKDEIKPDLLVDKVNFQVMGTNEWRHSSTLSRMSDDTITFYLDNTSLDDHYSLSKNSGERFIEQEVDFKDRSDAEDFSFQVIKDSLGYDLQNAVSFATPPFSVPVIISGSITASLNLEINKKDLDIVVRAYEQKPNRRYFALLTDSGFSALQRASYGKDRSHRQLLVAGKKENVEIKSSYITSKKLREGSRIIIVLGVNKSPYWQINYGTGKDVSEETLEDAGEPLKIKWFEDSFFRIPILRGDS
jgi:hypothetical protein